MKFNLFEHKSYNKENISKDRPLEEQKWQILLKHLINVNKRFRPKYNNNGNKGIITLYSDHIKAGSIVGVIATPVATIEILPKIFKYRDDEDGTDNRTGLIRLLSYVFDLPIKLPEAHLRRFKNLLEYYIRLFAEMLYDRLMSNYRREFVAVEDNSRYLKGRLLVAENIRHNYIHKERFFVRYDDFSPDNLLNRILKFTCKLLFDYTIQSQTKNILNQCLSFFEEVSDAEITSDDVECLRITRMTEDYRKIIDLVRLFIRYYSPTTEAGGHPTFAIAFDMEELFEKFCYRFIRAHLGQICEKLKSCNVEKQKDRYLLKVKDKDEKLFQLESDISITRGDESELIIDTKYKELKEATEGSIYKEHHGISQGDLYKMFAYLKKYDCKDGILLYPKYEGENSFNIMEGKDNDDYYNMEYDNDTKLHIRQVSLACLSDRGWHNKMIKEFKGCFYGLDNL